MTSLASSSGRSPMSARSFRSAGPTSRIGVPSAAAARAPATIAPGALSPPMASTAIGNITYCCAGRSTDFDSDAVLVPTAARAHGVRRLGVAATRACAASRSTQLPRTRAVAAALHLRLLLLGNGHNGSPGSGQQTRLRQVIGGSPQGLRCPRFAGLRSPASLVYVAPLGSSTLPGFTRRLRK